ncbi:hypothetical protein DIURU_004739 [Diutina rugosa]|uniref:Flavin reductase like domain-containing protein n=1 Tax=Diutina rugosa TaxID=5481 RepID=A0A642UJ70_DIURU|nr:uncharacterized protein DIURU_004739 [Diutina rugosa]KAA8897886.1 hypothetical protein DIURU_004739 [Diutina rugosa]
MRGKYIYGAVRHLSRMTYSEFKASVAHRPEFDPTATFGLTKVPNPQWKLGQGANSDEWKRHKKVELDPAERAGPENYKTLISGVVPRPIAFVSSVSPDGIANLAPISYFNLANNDPPIVTLGFSQNQGKAKDTVNNILATEECTINIISEWWVEAANMAALDCPPEVDEWKYCGLTPEKSTVVKPAHVAESAYSMECKLVASHEWKSKRTGKPSGNTLLLEVIRFHIRSDVLNDGNVVDINKLKPVSRLGGITYGRTTLGYELPKPLNDNLEDYQ